MGSQFFPIGLTIMGLQFSIELPEWGRTFSGI